MAGTSVLTERKLYKCKHSGRIMEKVIVDWVGDAANGSIPNLVIPNLGGYITKVITVPGTPNPTASYNVKLFDPEAPTLDSLSGLLAGRSASAIEEKYTTVSGIAIPVVVAGDYTLNVSGNSVNSAQGRVIIYLQEYL